MKRGNLMLEVQKFFVIVSFVVIFCGSRELYQFSIASLVIKQKIMKFIKYEAKLPMSMNLSPLDKINFGDNFPSVDGRSDIVLIRWFSNIFELGR